MRHIYPLIVGASLSLCPVVGLASTGAKAATPAAAQTPQPSRASAAPRAQPATSATAPKSSNAPDRDRYAAKEASSPNAKNYRGGDTLVIGASAVAAILAVVLLVVLL